MSDDNAAKAAHKACVDYNARKKTEEITRLRAALAAVTAERDRMLEALSYYAEEDYNGYNGSGACARAAIEGVTKKEGAGNEK